jgi:hypothetical protein
MYKMPMSHMEQTKKEGAAGRIAAFRPFLLAFSSYSAGRQQTRSPNGTIGLIATIMTYEG